MASASQLRFHVIVFAFGAVVLGLVDAVWREFAVYWQPIQALGVGDVPWRHVLAAFLGVLLFLGGIALLWRRSIRLGAIVTAIVFGAYAAFWLPRVIGFPQIYGTWGGFLEALALALAPAIVAVRSARAQRVLITLFGICVLSFGITHFTALPQTERLVPAWIPPGRPFWAITTGIFHTLAGISIITTVYDVLAARLWTAMILVFGVLVWLPVLLPVPHSQIPWAANGVNLAEAGAGWIVAAALAIIRSPRKIRGEHDGQHHQRE